MRERIFKGGNGKSKGGSTGKIAGLQGERVAWDTQELQGVQGRRGAKSQALARAFKCISGMP